MSQEMAARQQPTTIAQKTQMVAAVALFLAMPVIVLARKKAGYRFLNPTNIFAMVVLLFGYGSLTMIVAGVNPMATEAEALSGYTSSFAITAFALVVLVVALIKRFLRWNDIKKGIPWHTYSRGISWFSFIPLSDSKLRRFVDPIAVAIVGWLCLAPFKFLGYYLLLAAVCLFIFESWDYEQALNRSLDMLDSLVDSEVMSQNVEYYSQPSPQQRPLIETAGIPTGVSPDLEAQIQKRKARKALPPDNLVVTNAVIQP